MTQYIDKSAIVAGIKRLGDRAYELHGYSQFDTAYNSVLKFIDTLEVKEVDLKKAEQYIKDYTRNCSNELSYREYGSWLTPDHALRAVEIAKEETIKKACEWLDEHSWDYIRGDMFADKHMIKDFRKAMEE